MANQMIALQARAPQSAGLAPVIQQNAQLINMMSQQRAAERQAAQAQQTMDIQSALAVPQQQKAEADAQVALIKAGMDFNNFIGTALPRAANADQARMMAQRIAQQPQFQSPIFQNAIGEALQNMPDDPAQFNEWRDGILFQTMDAQKQLEQKFIDLTSGAETWTTAAPMYRGAGRAPVEVPGTRQQAPQDIQYLQTPQGIVPVPKKTMPGVSSGGAAPSGGDVFERMIGVESKGKQFGSSGAPLTSPKGAIGIAQVMPGTAPEAARLAGLPYDENRYRNDPEYNKALGRAYFQKQLADFGDERLAAAAYNAGPGAVRRALQRGGPDGWINYVPRETQDYVRKVFGGEGRGTAGGTQMGQVIPGTGKDIPPPKAAQAYNAMEAVRSKYDDTIARAERLLQNPSLNTIIGNVQGNIPETALSMFSQDAANALSDYNELLAVAGFQELQAMRDASPTGGALGQVSDSENRLLQQSAFASSRTQSEPKFRQSLQNYIQRLRASKARVEQAFNREFGQSGFAPAPPSAPKTKTRLRYNPATGDFE